MFTPVILNADSRLIRLKDYLDRNGIEPWVYLRALLKGDAPAVIEFGGDLFIDKADETRHRARLLADAHGAAAEYLPREAICAD